MIHVAVTNPSHTYRTSEDKGVYHTYITLEAKKEKYTCHLVQTLAPALTLILTLTLNHLAKQPQQTSSTLFGLIYLTNGSTMD